MSKCILDIITLRMDGVNFTFFAVSPTRLDVDRFEVALDGITLVGRSPNGVLRPRVPL